MAVSDIIVTPALVYRAPYGTTVPADTVAAGTAWGGSWVNQGYTNAPLSLLYEDEELDIMIEQALAPVGRVKTLENATFETVMAELTTGILAIATSGTSTATAAAVGQPGKEELTLGGEAPLDIYAWGFEGQYVDEDGATFPVRVFVWRGTARLNGALEFSKGAVVGTPIQIKALEDLTKTMGQRLFKVSKVLEPAS